MMNMQFWMSELARTIRRQELKQAGEICIRILNEVKTERQKPSVIFSPTKQQALQAVRTSLERLASSTTTQNPAQATAELAQVVQAFDALYANTIVYMMRHPEKTSEKGRVLSVAGVTQAHNYASLIINEILLCPKNVRVIMYTSEIGRTKKFAQLVAYELAKLGQMQGRAVNTQINGEDAALGFRFDAQGLDFVAKAAIQKGIPGDGGFANFMDWVNNAVEYAKIVPTVPNPKQIFVELHDFVSRSESRFPSSPGEWTVVLGFSHSWIIDVFRIQYGGSSVNTIIQSAGFVKVDINQILIDNAWHQYR